MQQHVHVVSRNKGTRSLLRSHQIFALVAALPGWVSYSTFALRSTVKDFTLSEPDLYKSMSMEKVIEIRGSLKYVSALRCAASSVGKSFVVTIRQVASHKNQRVGCSSASGATTFFFASPFDKLYGIAMQ